MHNQTDRHSLISSGNETLDKFLGGGFLKSTLNLFERQGPHSRHLEAVWNKSIAASTLVTGNLILVNFNSAFKVDSDTFLRGLPKPSRVKSNLLYKDVRGKSSASHIKIAWRYSNRNASPADSLMLTDQIDFGIHLVDQSDEEFSKKLRVINLTKDFSLTFFIENLKSITSSFGNKGARTNIICKDLLHPFSPLIDRQDLLIKLMYLLRAFSRTVDNGMIFTSYDIELIDDHMQHKQHLYNIADSVVSFYSYESGQNLMTGYKNINGTLDYVKVPKLNSFGFHFQRELSDWGYRLTRNRRFFVIDELSLPPCDDNDEDFIKKQQAADITNVSRKSIKQASPLEDFKGVAGSLLIKQL